MDDNSTAGLLAKSSSVQDLSSCSNGGPRERSGSLDRIRHSFTKVKTTTNGLGNQKSRKIRQFYKNQNELIDSFFGAEEDVVGTVKNEEDNNRIASIAAQVTLLINVLLLAGKVTASALTGSISIISSAADSAVDLVSGIIIWYTSRAMSRINIYKHPQGKTRLEPISIIILSCIMSLASIELIVESLKRIITGNSLSVKFDTPTYAIIGSTVVVKLIMFLVCRRLKSSSAQVLAQDHRNDVLSNTVALVAGVLGEKAWAYCDPIGAMLISIYIFWNWWSTGKDNVRMLSGRSAPPQLMQKITWICLNHQNIQLIDTVRAYSFGQTYLVEVDIVLPEAMTLKEAHDIGEPLQKKLECLPEVGRAFVHLDYECNHHPQFEHKIG